MVRVAAPVEGYSIHVFTRDEHPPAHVHVKKDGSIIKILLGENGVEYDSYKRSRPSMRMKNRALEIVADNLDACWEKWKAYHERR